ncbi:MAG TPA: phosphatase PAP2 family protein [Flavisolibacter sp.]|nr:phosphatase PAP2 family protein [Flavisolibacter sp.]
MSLDNIKKPLLFISFFLSFHIVNGQSLLSTWKQLDSLSRGTDTAKEKMRISNPEREATTRINIPVYFILLGSDFKQQLTAPFHTSGKTWKKVGAFGLLTGALAFADMPIQKQAFRIRNNSEKVRKVSRFITNFGGPYETYTLASLAAYGLLFKNEKTLNTTLLATQAYITGGMIESIAKYLSGRQRPSYYGVDTLGTPRFHGPISILGRKYNGQTVSSSFPSGHTTVAFAAATVFAMEYRNKPWVPVLAYSAASLIGISRITENRHWATDVLVGAALGYLSGRQVVNNYHRYAFLKSSGKKASPITFNFQYEFGHLMPGFVYHIQ